MPSAWQLPGEGDRYIFVVCTAAGSCSAHLSFLTWTCVRRHGCGTVVGTAKQGCAPVAPRLGDYLLVAHCDPVTTLFQPRGNLWSAMLLFIAICCDPVRDLSAVLTRPGFDLVATQFPIHRDRVCDLGSILSQLPCDLVAALRRPLGGPVASLLRTCGERAVISWRPRCHHVAIPLPSCCKPVATRLPVRCHYVANHS